MNDMNNGYNMTPPDQMPPSANDKSGLGTASLIMGIISIFTCGSTIVLPILGIIFGILSKDPITRKMDGNGKAGMICSILSLAFALAFVLFYVLIVVVIGGAACAAVGSV